MSDSHLRQIHTDLSNITSELRQIRKCFEQYFGWANEPVETQTEIEDPIQRLDDIL